MSIPNVPSLLHQIKNGHEGGGEFARIVRLLLESECKDYGFEFISPSDASGDFRGVDVIIKKEFKNGTTENIGIQIKFIPSNFTSNHKQEIQSSFINAIQSFPEMTKWLLITPDDISKRDAEWMAGLKVKHEFNISHAGHSQLINLFLHYPHIGRHYYPKLYPEVDGELSLDRVTVDSKNTSWMAQTPTFFVQHNFTDIYKDRTDELIFDFYFINNSDNTFLLYSLDVVLEEIRTELMGIPAKKYLKSLNTFSLKIDFSKKINTLNFDDPIIFNKGKQERFKLLLKDFKKECPGNYVKMHFDFHFGSKKISSCSVDLAFV